MSAIIQEMIEASYQAEVAGNTTKRWRVSKQVYDDLVILDRGVCAPNDLRTLGLPAVLDESISGFVLETDESQ